MQAGGVTGSPQITTHSSFGGDLPSEETEKINQLFSLMNRFSAIISPEVLNEKCATTIDGFLHRLDLIDQSKNFHFWRYFNISSSDQALQRLALRILKQYTLHGLQKGHSCPTVYLD